MLPDPIWQTRSPFFNMAEKYPQKQAAIINRSILSVDKYQRQVCRSISRLIQAVRPLQAA